MGMVLNGRIQQTNWLKNVFNEMFRALSNDNPNKKAQPKRNRNKKQLRKEKRGEEDPSRELMISFAKWIFLSRLVRFSTIKRRVLTFNGSL
jgi:hypothetical protein